MNSQKWSLRQSLQCLGCQALKFYSLLIFIQNRQFETGVREASINSGDLLSALKCLGLNTMEQEIMDLSNNLSKDGLIFFPDFCNIVLKRFREEDEEEFAKTMFKVFCGTDSHPKEFRAKKYKVHQRFLSLHEFQVIMRTLPVHIEESEILEMFSASDKNGDGQIAYEVRLCNYDLRHKNSF